LDQPVGKTRIDKWLWTVRIFKTRTMAGESCTKGRVLVNGLPAKASKDIKIGDTIIVRKPPVVYSYLVKGIPGSRLSPKLVTDYMDDQTSIEELDKLKIKDVIFFKRDRGAGRPTKKDRRQMDDMMSDL
jgi:ribosome-associated heat shock protein Hsp15